MDQKSLMQLANERAFSQLEDRWIEALATASDQLDELLRVTAWLVKARHLDFAETLLTLLLEALKEQRNFPALLTAAQHALSLFPDHRDFRTHFLAAFPAAHPENPLAAEIAAASGLPNGLPLDHCLDFIARRIHLRPGLYALHRMRRFPVRLESYSPSSDSLLLSDGSRTFSTNFLTFSDQYELLDDNDFRALKVFDPQSLAQLANDDPAELTIRYLKASGRSSTFRDFKDALLGSVIHPEAWKSWWSRTKPILLAHPLLDVSEGSQPSLSLRDAPREASLSWRTDFTFATHPRVQPAIALRYANLLADGVTADPELIELFRHGLAIAPSLSPTRAFASWLALTALERAVASTPPAYNPTWLKAPDAAKTFMQWCSWEPVYISYFTSLLPLADPDWPAIFAASLPYAPLALIENIVAALRSAQHAHLIPPALAPLSSPSPETAEALAWLWRTLATDPQSVPSAPLDLETATLALFRLVQQLAAIRHPGEFNVHAALATLRHTLAAKHYDLIRSVLCSFGSQRAADLYQLVMSNTGLSTPMRAQLVGLVSKLAASR